MISETPVTTFNAGWPAPKKRTIHMCRIQTPPASSLQEEWGLDDGGAWGYAFNYAASELGLYQLEKDEKLGALSIKATLTATDWSVLTKVGINHLKSEFILQTEEKEKEDEEDKQTSGKGIVCSNVWESKRSASVTLKEEEEEEEEEETMSQPSQPSSPASPPNSEDELTPPSSPSSTTESDEEHDDGGIVCDCGHGPHCGKEPSPDSPLRNRESASSEAGSSSSGCHLRQQLQKTVKSLLVHLLGEALCIFRKQSCFGCQVDNPSQNQHECLDTLSPVYRLKDYDGEPNEGAFYEAELQKVNVAPDKIYAVERVLDERVVRGEKQK
ncbi:hypothetical protein F2P81_019865 [Scophthalmus maximus]|uniref:Uncharacterized protein n=1 Tax=Scophthalmus maximus TaxID=52904 RepID=A0A6A4S8Z4_SCOMX|nr:hypothetical protein F2P81_019865 [Scophthalmus maximus]